jgi:nicotinamide riboside kinase
MTNQIWIIAGAESSGKTTLFNQLKLYLPDYTFIPELDRKWLEDRKLHQPFSGNSLNQLFSDCLHTYQSLKLSSPCIMDTDLLNLMIWAEHIQHPLHQNLENAWRNQKKGKYILCPPNIPYESDPLRTNKSTRNWVWKRHLEILDPTDYITLTSNTIKGRWDEIKTLFISP